MESDLAIDGESQFIGAEFATANYADVFGVRPSLGRWFVDDREPVAVISDAIWERYFDRRPDALGRVIQSGTDSYTIVGVAPREFTGVRAPLRTDLWAPIETRFRPTTEADERRLARMLMLFGRLRPGAHAREATTELNTLAIQMRGEPREEWPDVLLMLGDQVYADEVSPATRAFIETRRDVSEPPGDRVLDFEDYTRLYHESWSDPAVGEAIVAAGCNQNAVGGEGHADDRAPVIEHEIVAPRIDVPEPRLAVD